MGTSVEVVADDPLAGLEKRLWQAVIVTTIQEWISGPLRSKRRAGIRANVARTGRDASL